MRTKIYIVFTLFTLLVTAVQGQDLIILHTNDTHSQIESFKSGVHKGLGGVERRENYINSVRKEHPNKVLLLDAGDFSQGTPYFTIFKGDVEIELMNALGYDVACLGNHEFDNGIDEIARRAKNAKFPIVCANYNFGKSPLAGVIKPYTIIKRGGRKIGIIGGIVNLAGLVSPKSLQSIKYLHPYRVFNRYARELKKEGCELIILLTHCGHDWGNEQNPDDLKLAANTENIDIIVGGHSHTFIKKPVIIKNKAGKDVTVVQAGEKGCEIGRLDIWF